MIILVLEIYGRWEEVVKKTAYPALMSLPLRMDSGMRSLPASAMYRHVLRVSSHRSRFLGLDGGGTTFGGGG